MVSKPLRDATRALQLCAELSAQARAGAFGLLLRAEPHIPFAGGHPARAAVVYVYIRNIELFVRAVRTRDPTSRV